MEENYNNMWALIIGRLQSPERVFLLWINGQVSATCCFSENK